MSQSEQKRSSYLETWNRRNWSKIRVLAIMGTNYGQDWYSTRRLQEAFQKIYDEKPTISCLSMNLARYYRNNLLYRKNTYGRPFYYKINNNGRKRLWWLLIDYIPEFIREIRTNAQIMVIFKQKIILDVWQICNLVSTSLNMQDPKHIKLFLAAWRKQDPEWILLKEYQTLCAVLQDPKKAGECENAVKRFYDSWRNLQRKYQQ